MVAFLRCGMLSRSSCRAVERPACHGEHEIAPIFGADLDILKRLDRRGGRLARGLERLRSGRFAVQRRFGLGDAARKRLGAADADARVDDLAVRRGDRSRPPCSSAKSPARRENSWKPTRVSAGEQRQPHLGQDVLVLERRRHDPVEVVLGGDDARAAIAAAPPSRRRAWRRPRTIPRPDRRAPRCRRRCRGCGSDDARCCARRSPAAFRAAPRTPARRTPHGARRRRSASLPSATVICASSLMPLMSTRCVGLRQPERHDRHQALPAGQHPPVVGRDLRQHRDRFVERFRRVVAEDGGFHGRLGQFWVRTAIRACRSVVSELFRIWDFYYFLDSGTVFRLCKVLGRQRKPDAMKPPPFSYHDPRTVADAVGAARQASTTPSCSPAGSR